MGIESNPALADNQARVAVRLLDGRTFEHYTANCIGSMTHPMSDEQLAAKFRELVTPALGEADAGIARRVPQPAVIERRFVCLANERAVAPTGLPLSELRK